MQRRNKLFRRKLQDLYWKHQDASGERGSLERNNAGTQEENDGFLVPKQVCLVGQELL